jgi:predicted XRE-type DNA-binding protein
MVTQQMGGVVDDKLNVPLEDAELLAEVELTTNLIIAASESEASLSQAEVDALLGVSAPKSSQIPSQHRRPD